METPSSTQKPLAPSQSTSCPVTIGLPVFNGERTLAAAIESILNQSHRDFVLIISDNCSTDSTPEICRRFMGIDPRIRYHRQSLNKGAEENFRTVLRMAESEYFMWAASDDIRSDDFVEVNLKFLQNNTDYASSTSPARFENGEFDSFRMGDFSLEGDTPEKRVIGFFSTWHANGRFYGLHRRAMLPDANTLVRSMLAGDWLVVLQMAYSGKMKRHDQGWISLGAYGASKRDIFSVYRKKWYQWFFPASDFYKDVINLARNFGLASKFQIHLKLIVLNAKMACVQLVQSALLPAAGKVRAVLRRS